MGSPRLKGTALSFLIDDVDYWADASSVVLDGEDKDYELFGSPVIHSRRIRWWFDVEAIQSTARGSFWTLLSTRAGAYVPFGYAPHGNTVPDEDHPHFTGVLVLPEAPPLLGGEAGRTVEQRFTTRLHIAQGPYRVTTTE